MSIKQNELCGALFKATKGKRDYEGSVTVQGKEYWISGWKKPTKDGDVWISLALQEKGADVSDKEF